MNHNLCSESFQNYLSSCEIIHEKATIYTLQQNGRCERAMWTLMDHAISLSRLQLIYLFFLWDEAVNCSAYLMNRKLNSRDENPYVIDIGTKQDVSNPRIFGMGGQALDKYRDSKFGARSKSVRMVGC